MFLDEVGIVAQFFLLILKLAYKNRSNKTYFVVQPKPLLQLIAHPKNIGNLESELNNQHNQGTMVMVPPCSRSFSTGMRCFQPPLWPASVSLQDACYKLFLSSQMIFLELFIVKRTRFPLLLGSVVNGGGERQGKQLVTHGKFHTNSLHI